MGKAKAITKDITSNADTRRTIFRVLAGSLLALFIVYIYIIGSITFNVVARKSLENTSRLLSSDISQLEITYLNDMNDVNKDKALSLGFVDTKTSIFATRPITHVAIR